MTDFHNTTTPHDLLVRVSYGVYFVSLAYTVKSLI